MFPNVGDLDVDGKSFTVTFWRVSLETLARHRNPLFSEMTGMSQRNIGADAMHTLSMGVYGHYVSDLVWDLLEANCYHIAGPRSSFIQLGFNRMKEELSTFYAEEMTRGVHHTRIQQFLLSLFGKSTKRSSSLHAAETNGMLAFSEFLLVRHGHVLGERQLLHVEASETLRRIHKRIQAHPRKFPAEEIVGFCDDAQRHMRAIKALGIQERPKHHVLLEIAGRLHLHGSPALTACWDDEAANLHFKRLASGAHELVWHARVLSGWRAFAERKRRRES